MYNLFLILHNLLRWVVLIALVLAFARALVGWRGKKSWAGLDDRLGMLVTSGMDLQLLIGLILFFVLSPITKAALSNMGEAMSNAVMRFFLAEHFVLMVIAVIVAHIGRARARRAADAARKYRTTAIYFGIALLLVLAAIPWPFMAEYGRPWLRF